MFRVKAIKTNRVDIEIDNKIDSNDMKSVLDELIEASDEIEHGQMLYCISHFKVPTLGALAVEFSRIPKLLKLIARFDRIAIIADEEWIRRVGELEGAFIPGLEIKAFDVDELATAEKWLSNTEVEK